MKFATTAILLSLGLAASVPAQASVLVYDRGTVGFGYSQFPVGPYSGTFLSDGAVTDPGAFPQGGTGASMAIRTEVAGVHYLVVFGGRQNAGPSADVAFVFLRSVTPFAPGVYPVNPTTYSAIFGFVDDATSITIPQFPETTNWQAWVAGIIASHKLLSASGAIVLTSISDTLIEGTFSGIGGEFGGGVLASFTNGIFSLNPQPLAVESTSWSSVKALYR